MENPVRQSKAASGFRRDERGTAAVEFAFVAPVLIFIIMGILGYGGYFWMSHSVQQLANDAARAAIAGQTSTERASLAQAAVAAGAGDYAQLTPSKVTTQVIDRDGRLTVKVSYNAADSFAYVARGVAPMPSDQIQRQASIQLGGY
jgi:Flp pilus assembly protein TadG